MNTSEDNSTAGGRLRLAFYGDDFTGSTDALEVLAFAGLDCALFLEPPSPESLKRFGRLDAVGVAGDSRGMTPGEMDERLPDLLHRLVGLGAPIVHYKVCSTFDSAPGIGNIGHVIELARKRLSSGPVPVVAGNPALGRYCVFGHLFARSATDGKVHRIDRHPIMSVHPVTPMDEADLAVHLSRQATLAIASLSLPQLEQDRATLDGSMDTLLDAQGDAVLCDASTPRHLTEIGRLLARQAQRQGRPCFVVGSSGVEYALTQWWQEAGLPTQATGHYGTFRGVDRVLALSGSASKLTALQIARAIEAGFADVPVRARDLVDDDRWQATSAEIVARATSLLNSGRSVLLHTARGPDDPRIGEMIDALTAGGLSKDAAKHEGGRKLGIRLGRIVREILENVPLQRLLLSGGDTSSQVTQVLAPEALVVVARLAPGVPLCRTVSGLGASDGIEIALKGGQLGDEDFFEKARAGNA